MNTRRRMACWIMSEGGVGRTMGTCGIPDDLLRDAAEKWPSAEIEVTHVGGYSLLPGFGETGIPLGANSAEAELALRRLLAA